MEKIYAIKVPTMTTNALRARIVAQAIFCVPVRRPGKFFDKKQYEY